MQKKELQLAPRILTPLRTESIPTDNYRPSATKWLTQAAIVCSRVSGLHITPRMTLHMLRAQIGIFFTLLPVPLPVSIRLMAMMGVGLSLFVCFRKK